MISYPSRSRCWRCEAFTDCIETRAIVNKWGGDTEQVTEYCAECHGTKCTIWRPVSQHEKSSIGFTPKRYRSWAPDKDKPQEPIIVSTAPVAAREAGDD